MRKHHVDPVTQQAYILAKLLNCKIILKNASKIIFH